MAALVVEEAVRKAVMPLARHLRKLIVSPCVGCGRPLQQQKHNCFFAAKISAGSSSFRAYMNTLIVTSI